MPLKLHQQSKPIVYHYFLRVKYNNRVDVRGHKYVFGPTQTHFSLSEARVKMSSEGRAKNIFMPKNICQLHMPFKQLFTTVYSLLSFF